MLLPSLLTLALSILTTVTALPQAISPYSPSSCKSTVTPNGGVFFCNEPNWGGNCGWRAYSTTRGSNWCYSFQDIDDRPRSVGPDPSGWCEMFGQEGCKGEAVEIWKGVNNRRLECPGVSNTGKPEWWVSMKCWAN